MAIPKEAPPIVIRRQIKKGKGSHHTGSWKVAYADFVTALMAFFMLLWLLSTPDKKQLEGLAKYFSPLTPAAEAGTGTGEENNPTKTPKAASEKSSTLRTTDGSPDRVTLANDVKAALLATPIANAMDKNLHVEPTADGTRIELMDTANKPVFDPASGRLNAYGVQIFRTVGRTLGAHGARIAIEGHTDGTGGYSDSNWRLGSERADSARMALEYGGVLKERIAEIVSRGHTRLAYPDDPLRPENRRVTVMILDEAPAVPNTLALAPTVPFGPLGVKEVPKGESLTQRPVVNPADNTALPRDLDGETP